MKTLRQQKMFFWAILALSFIISGNVCFGTERETIATLEKQVIQIEEIWKAGDTNEYFIKANELARKINPLRITYTREQEAELVELWKAGKTNEYYAKANEFDDKFRSHSITGNLNKIAAELFDNIMSKKANLIDSDNKDLYALEDLRSYLTSNDKVSIKERRVNALLLCRFLGKIRKEIVPNFKPKRAVRNVAPPPETPCAIAGMNPATITNPVLRAQYEASIRENHENGLMNARQGTLRSMGDKLMSTRIIDYIIKTFRGDDASVALLNECIKAANLTDKEKEEVLKKVGGQIKK